jgi:hypothetical protein
MWQLLTEGLVVKAPQPLAQTHSHMIRHSGL